MCYILTNNSEGTKIQGMTDDDVCDWMHMQSAQGTCRPGAHFYQYPECKPPTDGVMGYCA
jgi:hypothetical protein